MNSQLHWLVDYQSSRWLNFLHSPESWKIQWSENMSEYIDVRLDFVIFYHYHERGIYLYEFRSMNEWRLSCGLVKRAHRKKPYCKVARRPLLSLLIAHLAQSLVQEHAIARWSSLWDQIFRFTSEILVRGSDRNPILLIMRTLFTRILDQKWKNAL